MKKRDSSHTPWQTLAQILSSEAGLEAAKLMQCLGLLPAEARDGAGPARADAGRPRDIGPYKAETVGGELAFVREPALDMDEVWWKPTFMTEVLKVKKPSDPHRICFIGESAAAGMFFTPHYSPALALEQHLQKNGAQRYEVIDLTRNSMNADLLADVTESALQLRPDFVVVFAGNNWFAGLGLRAEDTPAAKREYAAGLLEHGAAGPVRTFQARLRAVARATVARLGAAVAAGGGKLVFVVPPVSPLWERQEPVPWLGGGRTRCWFEAYVAATRALEENDHAAALDLGRAMTELDGGTCSTSHRIVANALIGLGRLDEARQAWTAEIGCVNCWDTHTPVPATPTHVAEEIRRGAEALGAPCVDLPRVFVEHARSPIHHEKLFVDYCHYSREGMIVATAPIAVEILRVTEPARVGADGWRGLLREALAAPGNAAVDAVARFNSALYTSHVERPVVPHRDPSRIERLLDAAVATSPDVLHAMESYVKARNGAFVEAPLISQPGLNHAFSANSVLDAGVVNGVKGLDPFTIDAVCTVLDKHGRPGKALRASYLEHYRRRLERGIDLADPLFQERTEGWASRWSSLSEWGTWRTAPFVRALWPSSRFFFVADDARDLRMKISCRLPGAQEPREGEVAVRVNGTLVGTFRARDRWTAHALRVDRRALVDGFNAVVLEWPELVEEDDTALDRAQRRYFLGQPAEFFPIFGEVFSFRVEPGG